MHGIAKNDKDATAKKATTTLKNPSLYIGNNVNQPCQDIAVHLCVTKYFVFLHCCDIYDCFIIGNRAVTSIDYIYRAECT